MPKIGRFPPFGKRFFRQARKIIGCCHFSHFWRVVIALAAMHGRRNLRRIAAVGKNHRSRQAIAFFLTKAHWDAPEVLRQTALDTLKKLGWRPGQTVYLAVDDTQKRKRGKHMDAVSRIFLHAEKIYAQGHTIVGCAWIYRGVVIPCAVRLWASEEFCVQTQKPSHPCEPREFRKLTELAAEAIEQRSHAFAPIPGLVTATCRRFYVVLSAGSTRRPAQTAISRVRKTHSVRLSAGDRYRVNGTVSLRVSQEDPAGRPPVGGTVLPRMTPEWARFAHHGTQLPERNRLVSDVWRIR